MAHQKGFTLLEVLLVVVILAAAVAGVTAMQSDRLSTSGKLRQRADAFRQSVEYAVDLALLEKHAVALRLSEEGWALYLPQIDTRTGWQWVAATNHDNLPLHGEWERAKSPDITPSTKGTSPQIIIMPDGQMTPFTLLFRKDDGEKILLIHSAGSLPLDIRPVKEPQ
ncbi:MULTISPECIES: GspH/FimT family protein [Enterobacter]|uniref:GspH/FimT family protein n=1 Tax=Enterobacter TaxID=547 RepID=UPI0028EAD43E|nr:GspH/FimT family protein [Enterobacter cloacae]HDR2755565.1 GspH/FimT family protein [Enterobacter asburiae]WNT36155.1 GspH/FimT family protein [Enterobacter cloacae]HDR2790032.1 GspH/FimT family protein [Enterobacter asburiae]HDR2795440.1 GspH/FimT family protein [Enterobacter asburiae]HDR2800821.1 GspH/FimT family protein [Enterobacter asburiae]